MTPSITVAEAYDRARDAAEAHNELTRNLIQDGEVVGLLRYRDPVVYGFSPLEGMLVSVHLELKRHEYIDLWTRSRG